MKAIAYKRRSQDSGTGVSEEIQDEGIRDYVARKGGEVAYWLPPDLDASSWTLDRPSMQEALRLVRSGKADAIVVAKLSRLTRRPADWAWLLETMQAEGWTIMAADFDVDLSTAGGRMIAGIVMQVLAFEYEEKRDGYDDARRNAVLVHGVHGGVSAPLGYEFTVGRTVDGQWRTHDRKGKALRGPLTPNADAPKIRAAFEAADSDDPAVRAWSNIVGILGVKSQGSAYSILTNKVYVGTAYSNTFVNENAHPALVDKQLFDSVNRKLEKRSRNGTGRSVAYGNRPGALLSRVLKCAGCGHSLISNGKEYRCKNRACRPQSSVRVKAIEPVVFFAALAWHAAMAPMHADAEAVVAAQVPVYEQELAKAQTAVAALDAALEAGEMDAVTYGKAATAARHALAAAETQLAEAEASRGWLGMSTEAVQRRLLGPGNTCKDVEQGRDFIRQMVRVTVRPAGGRGKRMPVQDRIEIENLTPAAAAAPQPVPEEIAA
jgi:DNA invertase Pin-like site-specific DNA recombinase